MTVRRFLLEAMSAAADLIVPERKIIRDLHAQRDRLRERIVRLESDVRTLSATNHDLNYVVQRLQDELEEAVLAHIEASNPGINMDDVRASRARARQARTEAQGRAAAARLADHLKSSGAQGAIVTQEGSADEDVERLLADGWTWFGETEYVEGKRVRYLRPPKRDT